MADEQQQAAAPPQLVLYKAPQAWGLPSLSMACVQVEVRLLGDAPGQKAAPHLSERPP